MSVKQYSPQEAAIAVLKKAEELYKSSSLAKGDWKKIHDKLEREGYSKESADKIDGAIKAKVQKSDEAGNPDMKQDAALGEKVEQDVAQHEKSNEDPAHAVPSEKGHIKLAKFVGAMQAKRGNRPGAAKEMDKGETGHEKGVHTQATQATYPGAVGLKPGMSASGVETRMGATGGAKNEHKQVLDQMQSMPKPKLPG